ncbi:MAG TPA: aminodeoxychorismate synthase component I [Balneolaceae bacterium]
MKVDLEKLTHFFSQKGTVLLLESQFGDHPASRKSYLAALPKAEIKARDDEVFITENDSTQKHKKNPWQALQAFRKVHNEWLFGYLGYDLKNHTEKLTSQNPDQIRAPDLYFMVPQFLIEVDRETSEGKLLIGNFPPKKELDSVETVSSFSFQNIRPQLVKSDYLARIREAQHRIREGTFYEINLSHQLKGKFNDPPLVLYKQMKEVAPVPFGAFFQNDDVAVCCQSPERFLRKEGDIIYSQPIKGTSPRGKDENEDFLLKEKLLSSEKEQAENLMIVDLVRNDLSRIARPASVKALKLFEIETFGTVHQMVSTVTAEADEEDPVAILKACFPMGSMTGAPKISAMQAIEELENYRRGIYSGALGYITPQGNFDFNVVIRTAIIKNDELFYSVGGAITADSDPECEWKETLIKARALTDAVSLP